MTTTQGLNTTNTISTFNPVMINVPNSTGKMGVLIMIRGEEENTVFLSFDLFSSSRTSSDS